MPHSGGLSSEFYTVILGMVGIENCFKLGKKYVALDEGDKYESPSSRGFLNP